MFLLKENFGEVCWDAWTAQQIEVEEYGQSGQPISAYSVVFMPWLSKQETKTQVTVVQRNALLLFWKE